MLFGHYVDHEIRGDWIFFYSSRNLFHSRELMTEKSRTKRIAYRSIFTSSRAMLWKNDGWYFDSGNRHKRGAPYRTLNVVLYAVLWRLSQSDSEWRADVHCDENAVHIAWWEASKTLDNCEPTIHLEKRKFHLNNVADLKLGREFLPVRCSEFESDALFVASGKTIVRKASNTYLRTWRRQKLMTSL
jgi:hypothetical protein